MGLSWTLSGGSLLLVEATKLEKGSGKLTLTGQLGNVMQESARLALNWVRSVANQVRSVELENVIQKQPDLPLQKLLIVSHS